MQLFSVGSVSVQVYGLLLALGVTATLCWMMARCRGMKEGTVLAAELLDSGKALDVLQRFVEVSNRPEAEA